MFRKFAAVVIAVGVAFGTAGCNMVNPVASIEAYTPSDGSQADLGQVAARNFILLTHGEHRWLVGTIVNSGLDNQQLSLSYEEEGATKVQTITLTPGQKFDLGYNGTSALMVKTDTPAGALFPVTLAAQGVEPVALAVPALDSTLEEYKLLIKKLAEDAGIEFVEPTAAPTKDATHSGDH
jgi:hypothetical protein